MLQTLSAGSRWCRFTSLARRVCFESHVSSREGDGELRALHSLVSSTILSAPKARNEFEYCGRRKVVFRLGQQVRSSQGRSVMKLRIITLMIRAHRIG